MRISTYMHIYLQECKRHGCVNTRVHPYIRWAPKGTRIYWRSNCEIFVYVQIFFLAREPWWAKDLVCYLFHFICKTHDRFRCTWQSNLDSPEDEIAIVSPFLYLLLQLIMNAFWIVRHVLFDIIVVIFDIVSRWGDASSSKYNRGTATYAGYVFARLSNLLHACSMSSCFSCD